MKALDPIVVRLRDARLTQGLTLKQVAQRAGVGTTTVFYWEQGGHQPSLSLLRVWASALGYEVSVKGGLE